MTKRNLSTRFPLLLQLVALFHSLGVKSRILSCCWRHFRMACGGHIAAPGTCDSRLCPVCAARRAFRLQGQYKAAAGAMRDPRHMILTMPRVPFGLDAPELKRKTFNLLVRAFRKLRRDPCMSQVRGGAYSIHLEPKRDGWHAHLHVLVDGWIEARDGELCGAWSKALGVEMAVAKVWPIRRHPEQVLGYTVDIKPELLETLRTMAVADVQAFVSVVESGAHTFETFGGFKKIPEDENAEVELPRACPCCGGSCKAYQLGIGPLYREWSWSWDKSGLAVIGVPPDGG